MSDMWVFLLGLVAVGAVVAVPKAAKAASKGKSPAVSFEDKLRKAAGKLRADVLASARKWATARGIPLVDVIATILLESRGDPKARNHTAKEDSRGLMQVNVNAHPQWAKANLYDVDKGIEAGTSILASARARVREEMDKCAAPLAFDWGTYARLWYALPAAVQKMLRKAKSRKDTEHPFRDAEVYVEHWQAAVRVARGVVIS